MRLFRFGEGLRTERTKVIKMERRGVCSEKKGLRRKRMDERGRVDVVGSPVNTMLAIFLERYAHNLRVKRDSNFCNNIPRHRIRSFDNAISSR